MPPYYAIEREWTPANPAHGMNITVERAEIRLPTIEEIAAVLTNLSERAGADPEMWHGFAVLVLALQGSGLRIGEARALTWDDVDLEQGVIKVRQSASRRQKIGQVKSRASYRTVAIDDHLISALRRWKPLCPPGKHNLIFPNGAGNVESQENLYSRRWTRVMEELGFMRPSRPGKDGKQGDGMRPLFAFHGQRHFRISRMIAAGANLKQIMDEASHATPAMTLGVYGHLFPEDVRHRQERANRISLSLNLRHPDGTQEPNPLKEGDV
jgi:integrase